MKTIAKLSAAAIVSAVSLNAAALTPWSTTPDLEVVFSGATAPDKLLRTLIQNICTAGTYDEFSADTSFPSKAYSAYYCTLDGANPSVSAAGVGGLDVIFYKRSAGGSFEGTEPVASQTPGNQLDLSSASNCTAAGGNQYTDCGSLTTKVSDAGTSDLPPDVFFGPNVGASGNACDSACVAALDSAALTQLVFGVPVTAGLYETLQLAQGLNTDVDGVNGADVYHKADFENNANGFQQAYLDNMPSLTKEQVASLFSTGGVADFANVTFMGASLPSYAAVAPVNTKVHVCRRVNGSGTQASFNLNIMNAPLNSANNLVISPDNTPCLDDSNGTLGFGNCPNATETSPVFVTSQTQVVIENSGSGNVTTCLDNIQDQGGWALGVQSLEKKSDKWAFIKLDGVAPTLENAAKGNYFHWGDVSMQWAAGVPTGNKLAVLQLLRGNLADPAELNSANVSKSTFPFGLSGSLSKTATPIVPFDPALPVAQWEHKGNNSFQIPQPRSGASVEFK